MHADSRRDWAAFTPAAIPSKPEIPQLELWLSQLSAAGATRLLDLGCGTGVVTRMALERGFSVAAVDINRAALAQLQNERPDARVYERDIASADGLSLPESPFDAVVCQLVLSVIGDVDDRRTLLRNVHAVLRAGGELYLSASARSEDLNPEYAALYARDRLETGEHGSYFSRDAAGRVLYRTHHFAHAELVTLLTQAGFDLRACDERVEVSSRRPDQRARFYYVTASRTDRSSP
ncbi:MAG: class I SAM-dependent methyltransferase [Polyangiales bacterium]